MSVIIKKCSAGISLIILLLFVSIAHAESSMCISGGCLLPDLQQSRCAARDHEPDSQTGINALIDFEFNGHSFIKRTDTKAPHSAGSFGVY